MEKLSFLLKRYRSGTCTPAERQELMDLVRDPANEPLFKNLLDSEIDGLDFSDMGKPLDGERADHLFAHVLAAGNVGADNAGLVVAMVERKPAGWWVAAAAVVLLLGGFFFTLKRRSIPPKPATSIVHDALPGSDKAVLTTGNGQQIVLDSTASGLIAKQGSVSVTNQNGQLIYTRTGGETAVTFNTISVPRGGQYQLTLADGTGVWLNSASTLTYPTFFTGGDRKVSLTGEGYFEVAHNPDLPFHVQIGATDIQDIGTRFNINAYTDEAFIKTTLIEGAVKVNNTLLRPGEQAQLGMNGAIRLVKDADIDEAIAWKTGFFDFERADIATILRQIGRWYDLDILYKGTIPQREFRARMSRNTRASEVLKILDESQVHYTLEGKTLTIIPWFQTVDPKNKTVPR
jgi:hypothetical protein